MNWSRDDLMQTLDRASGFFSMGAYHLFFRGERTGITRFANNEITDNQHFADAGLTIRAYDEQRTGVATINQLDADWLQRGIGRAEALARHAPADPEYTCPPELQEYREVGGYDAASAQTSPADRAALVAAFVRECQQRKLNAAGYIQTTEETVATLSSSGAAAYHRGTTVRFSMSAKTEDVTGSGWVLRWANACSDLDIPALANVAMTKARASQNPVSLTPGRYTVVLEPVACEFLLWNLTNHLDARGAEEGRSFLSKFDAAGKPAGTRAGERVFSPLFTVKREVGNRAIQTHPFDENGTALPDFTLIDKGVLKELSYDPYWAKQKGVRPTGELRGMLMSGSGRSTEDLIKEVDEGVLVTRLWYIRSVDRMKSAVTGMTRDGTFRIEGGEVAEPIKNFRFNEELRRVFRDFTAASTPQRFWDWHSPAIVVPDFNFTSTTESI